MKAVIWTGYGSPHVLQLGQIEKPLPANDEVLIRIRATTVTAGDCEARSLKFPGLLRLAMRAYVGIRKPKRLMVLGQELAGDIEAVGQDVRNFTVGNQVFAATDVRFGAYAEYICLRANGAVAIKPANATYEEAAAIPVGGLNALHFLGKADIQPGQKVLINGAGGSIGTVAVQLARSHGAEVTAVDSTDKLDMLRSIGAHHVIDFTQVDFTGNGKTYDVILDVVGKSSFTRCVRSLDPNGTLLMATPTISRTIRGRWISRRSGRKIVGGSAPYLTEDLTRLKELVEAGSVSAVIDKRFTLEQIVEAHRYVETGQKTGNVSVSVEQ